jgi:outer membrane protein OmpA-like peptidoglycan-associated protein
MTLNQISLQACIQLELGEISPEKYADIILSSTSRYVLLTRIGADVPLEEEEIGGFATAANAPLIAAGESLSVSTSEIRRRVQADQSRLQEATPQAVEDYLTVVRADNATVSAELASTATPQSTFIQAVAEAPSRSDASSLPALPAVSNVNMTYLLFDVGSAQINAADMMRLRLFLSSNCCDVAINVYGFADTTGTVDLNEALSRLRAARVAAAIQSAAPSLTVHQAALGEVTAFGPLRDNRVVYVLATPKTPASR